MSSLLKQTEMNAWYRTSLGQKILSLEQQQINHYLSRVFGYYAVSLGNMSPHDLSTCPIRHQVEILQNPLNIPNTSLCMDFEQLAFQDNSIDLFILPHALQDAANPLKILAEISRCLIPQGSLFIIGFNPYSLFGLRRWLQSPSEKFPWNGHYYSPEYITHQLAKLDLIVESSQCFYFRPPIYSTQALTKLRFMETLGPIFWPYFGSVYTLLARKHVSSATPLPSSIKKNETLSDYVTTYSSTLRHLSHDD